MSDAVTEVGSKENHYVTLNTSNVYLDSKQMRLHLGRSLYDY